MLLDASTSLSSFSVLLFLLFLYGVRSSPSAYSPQQHSLLLSAQRHDRTRRTREIGYSGISIRIFISVVCLPSLPSLLAPSPPSPYSPSSPSPIYLIDAPFSSLLHLIYNSSSSSHASGLAPVCSLSLSLSLSPPLPQPPTRLDASVHSPVQVTHLIASSIDISLNHNALIQGSLHPRACAPRCCPPRLLAPFHVWVSILSTWELDTSPGWELDTSLGPQTPRPVATSWRVQSTLFSRRSRITR